MDGARVAGFVVVALVLLMAGLLGAPLGLVVLLAVVIGGIGVLVTVLSPGGVGAQSASNLARKLYDRNGWESGWSGSYLGERRGGPLARRRARRRREVDVPPDLLPEDLQESKAWLRTLESIRRLPER
ncbi:MAG: hypothetical protein M3Q23_12245 [Actinomycetota bacterium]|nr:hypothetical protein [Actinomycetota bacterium]